MTSHIANLPAAKIPVHIPAKAPAKVTRIIRMPRRWPNPQIIVEMFRRLTLRRQITRPRNLPIAPRVNCRQIADRTVDKQFAHTVEVRVRMTLRTNLSSKLMLLLQPVAPHDTRLLHSIC